MMNMRIIVMSGLAAFGIVAASGCGQKGNLYLPTAPEAAHRAPLHALLLGPLRPTSAASSPAATAAALPTAGNPVDAVVDTVPAH